MPGPVAFLPAGVDGIWFPVSLAGWRLLVARWFWGAAWLVALTTRSSGRVRVTPSRRRALWPWARLPITVAAALLGGDELLAQTEVTEAVVGPHGWLVLRPAT